MSISDLLVKIEIPYNFVALFVVSAFGFLRYCDLFDELYFSFRFD